MKLSLRGWIFSFFCLLAGVNILGCWWLFGRSSATTNPPAPWQVLAYVSLVLLASAFLAQRLWVIVTRSKNAMLNIGLTGVESKRLVYVGADSFREGRVCGEMMAEVLGGRGKVAIVTSEHGLALRVRETGFTSILLERYAGIEIVATIHGEGRKIEDIQQRVSDLLAQFPDLDGMYIVDGNTPADVIPVLVKAQKARKIKLVCHDMVDDTMRGLADGIVSATLSQDPFAQGYDPVIYLYNYLVTGQKPPRAKMTTQLIRITPENYRQYWDPQRGVVEASQAKNRLAKPVDQSPSHPLKIVFMGIDTKLSPFFVPLQDGMKAAAELLRERNTTIEWIDPADISGRKIYDANTYRPAMEYYRNKHYHAMAVLVHDKELISTINHTVEAGIPVATYNSEPESTEGLMASILTQSRDLHDITITLAQSARQSGERAAQINLAITDMRQALTLEAQSAVQAIESTREIATAIASIDSGAQEQFQAAGSASEATRNISSAVDGTRHATLASEKTAVQAVQIAQQGAQTIQQTLGQIDAIGQVVNTAVEKIHALNQLTRQIDSIVAMVTDLAEQTNMLALNAHLEAARAGEDGRGFAVVATEIRALAEKSKAFTKEIAGLIRTVQRNSGQIVETVDEAALQAKTGSQLANQAGEALRTLLRSAETMREQSEQVVAANGTVVESLEMLNHAYQRVSGVISENASAIRQVTQNAQQTVERVNHMTGISKDNVVTIEGIHGLSDEVADHSEQLKVSIASLVQMSEELQGAVVAFKLNQGAR